MTKRLLVCVSFMLLSWGASAQVKTVTTYLGSAAKRADHLYEHQYYEEAIKLYQQALQKESEGDQDRIKLQLAESFRKLNDPEQAAWWYSQVINQSELIAPEHKLHYAQSLLSIGEIQEAEVWYTRYQQSATNDERATQKLQGIDQMPTFYRDSLMYIVEPMSINSPASDFAPAFYQNGLAFISARETQRAVKQVFRWNETPYLSRFFLPSGDEAAVQPLSLFGSKSKRGYHQGPVAFYENDTRAILTQNQLTRNRNPRRTSTLGLFSSQRNNNGKWTDPVPLSFNDPTYSVGHPATTSDGKTLYFISDMPGGIGGTDLYVSHYQDGIWQAPVNLGRPINTEGNEMFPFIHQDQTLYFSSNGHGGLGGLDIYKTVIGSNVIENIGYPVNSSYDDFSLILNEEGTQGYYASNRQGSAENDDLYQLTTHFQYLDVLVSDEYTQQQIEGTEVTLIQDGAIMSTVVSDSAGRVRFRLNPHHIYIINVDKPEYDGNAVIIGPEEILASDNTATFSVPLVRTEGSIDLTVVLTNSYTDQPLPHTLVSVVNTERGDTTFRTTDEQGRILMKVDNRSRYIFSGQVGETSWNHPEVSTRNLNPDQENELRLQIGIQTPTVPLYFIVYDTETQEPIERVTVRLIEDGEERAELRTSVRGETMFKADPQSNYLVSLEAHTHFGDVIIISSDELMQDTVYRVEVPLKSVQGTIGWAASLYDSATGAPLAHAVVRLEHIDTGEIIKTFSDEWGRVRLDLEEGVSYRISSSRNNQRWVRNQPIIAQGRRISVFIGSAPLKKIALEEEIIEEDIPLLSETNNTQPGEDQLPSRTQLLLVKVIDGNTRLPVSAAEITLIGDGAVSAIGSSDTTGLAQFTINPATSFIIDVGKDDYQGNAIILDAPTLLSYADSCEAILVPQPQVGTVDLIFRLSDSRTGQPIKHTLAQLVNLSTADTLNVVTNEKGVIQTKVDTRSAYQISGVIREQAWDYPIIEAEALNTRGKNQISIPIDVPISTTPLRVVAAEVDTGNPLAKVLVRLIEDGEQQASGHTDTTGEVQFEVNPEQNYLISAESSSHYDDVVIVMSDELVPQREHRLKVMLVPGKKMINMVAYIYDSLSREPLTNTLVRIYNETAGKEITSLSDEQGNIRMKLERGITYRISGRAKDQDWEHDAKVNIDDNNLADLVLKIAVYQPSSQNEWLAEAVRQGITKDTNPTDKKDIISSEQLKQARVTVVNSRQRSGADQAVWVEIDERIYHLVQQNTKQYLRYQREKIPIIPNTGLSEHWWLNTENDLVMINTIHFGFDQYALDATAKQELAKIAELMQRQPDLRLEATTHTDSRGAQSYNRVLSQRRAQAIATYLVKSGVAEDRVYLNFYGEDQPLEPCPEDGCSESVHQKNRRGEFMLDLIY